MNDKTLDQPVTKRYLNDFTDKVVFPRVEQIVDDKVSKFRDEILTSNDKLSVKLDKILTEQASITVGFRRLEERVNYLEIVLKTVAGKTGVPFSPPENI